MKILIELIGPTQCGKTHLGSKMIEAVRKEWPTKTLKIKKSEALNVERITISLANEN